MTGDSDETLLKRIACRDQSAMRAFYERHHVRVYRFMLRIVGNEARAEASGGSFRGAVERQHLGAFDC